MPLLLRSGPPGSVAGRHTGAMERQIGVAREAGCQDAPARTDACASALPTADPNNGNPASPCTGFSKFDTVTPTNLIPFSGGKSSG